MPMSTSLEISDATPYTESAGHLRRMTSLGGRVSRVMANWRVPPRAKAVLRADRRADRADPGPQVFTRACMEWLVRAQDHSITQDGGVARHFSLLSGWSASYPETTGYIVPTVLDYAARTGDPVLRERGRRMLDWLTAIQFPEGGIQGGTIDFQPRVPVTFNTGQVLLGFAAGVREFGDCYREPMCRAAHWLRDSQDADGCWRTHPTPFAVPGEKTYETHVAWGLFEAARLAPGEGYGEAGLRQVSWALAKQRPNGWFADCCLTDSHAPLTHTLGYALRGILEAHLYAPAQCPLDAAIALADALLARQEPDGRLSGRYDASWRPHVRWACPTGIAQIAICWLRLFELSGVPKYRDAACKANRYVRRRVRLDGDPDICGGVPGSFPVDGGYGPFQYLSWAAKFCIDANLLEMDLDKLAASRIATRPSAQSAGVPA